MLMYRSAKLLTLDQELLPVWLVKMAGFTGLGFTEFGSVSGFAWYGLRWLNFEWRLGTIFQNLL